VLFAMRLLSKRVRDVRDVDPDERLPPPFE
jgi:hypothetical protein